MSIKSQVVVIVKMIDTSANPPVAQGRITAAGVGAGWKAVLGKTPFIEFDQEFPKWATPAVKEAVYAAIGKCNVPCEFRTVLVENIP